jgi:hypothetical protein
MGMNNTSISISISIRIVSCIENTRIINTLQLCISYFESKVSATDRFVRRQAEMGWIHSGSDCIIHAYSPARLRVSLSVDRHPGAVVIMMEMILMAAFSIMDA